MKLLKKIKRHFAILSLAMTNVEKNAFGQKGDDLEIPFNQEVKKTQTTLADSLKQGEMTQEVMNLRWRTYKVLQASENNKAEITGYDENDMPITKVTKTDNKRGLKKISLDKVDSYPLELLVDNSPIIIGGTDGMDSIENEEAIIINYSEDGEKIASHGEISSEEFYSRNKNTYPISINRKVISKFQIETYTKKLHVRSISETEKLLEFYVSMYPDEYDRRTRLFISDIKKAKENSRSSSMLEIDEVSFITDKTIGTYDLLEYKYKVTSFDKIIEFNGNYVIKYKANVIINGRDITEKHRVESLDTKYDNKEIKKGNWYYNG